MEKERGCFWNKKMSADVLSAKRECKNVYLCVRACQSKVFLDAELVLWFARVLKWDQERRSVASRSEEMGNSTLSV